MTSVTGSAEALKALEFVPKKWFITCRSFHLLFLRSYVSQIIFKQWQAKIKSLSQAGTNLSQLCLGYPGGLPLIGVCLLAQQSQSLSYVDHLFYSSLNSV